MRVTVQEVNLNPKEEFTPINIPYCYTKITEFAFYYTNQLKRYMKSIRLTVECIYFSPKNKIK